MNLIVTIAEKMYLPKIKKFLEGKKTYLILAIYILANSQELLVALQQLTEGQINLVQFLDAVQKLILAFAGMAAKAGINRVETKHTELLSIARK
jgi:hypothetical protein